MREGGGAPGGDPIQLDQVEAWDGCEAERFFDAPEALQSAWSHFLKAHKVVVETVDRQLARRAGMSLPELELMLGVDAAGGRIRFVTLSKVNLLSPAQVSRRVASLQDKGYLLRIATDQDRRATFAVMTEAGRRALAKAQPPFLAALNSAFISRIPPEKFDAFREVLESLVNDPSFPEAEHQLLNEVAPLPTRVREIPGKKKP